MRSSSPSTRQRILPGALLASALGACTATGQVAAPAPTGPAGPEPPFETATQVAVSDDGTTDLVELPLGPGHGALVIRVVPVDAGEPEGPGAGESACVQIDSVTDSDGGEWVPPAATQTDWGAHCQTCEQRASVGHGYGLFVFSNNGDPLPDAATVKLRVTLRDCVTRLPLNDLSGVEVPASVRVESFRTPALPAEAEEGHLSLFLAFAEGTQFTSTGADPILGDALAAVDTTFRAAGIAIDVIGSADFPAGTDRVVYSDADREPLDALYRRADDARRAAGHGPESVLVVFAPCLVEEDILHGVPARPDGMVPRLPGGFSPGGHADAVFLRAAGCDPGAGNNYWLGGGLLGKVMAHELGHYLGLYHSVEASGDEDHLGDTNAQNLMFHAPVAAAAEGLSLRQARVLRSHPMVTFER